MIIIMYIVPGKYTVPVWVMFVQQSLVATEESTSAIAANIEYEQAEVGRTVILGFHLILL